MEMERDVMTTKTMTLAAELEKRLIVNKGNAPYARDRSIKTARAIIQVQARNKDRYMRLTRAKDVLNDFDVSVRIDPEGYIQVWFDEKGLNLFWSTRPG